MKFVNSQYNNSIFLNDYVSILNTSHIVSATVSCIFKIIAESALYSISKLHLQSYICSSHTNRLLSFTFPEHRHHAERRFAAI